MRLGKYVKYNTNFFYPGLAYWSDLWMDFDAQWLITLGIMQRRAFLGTDAWLTTFRGSNSAKTATNRQKIGHFMREVDENEEWCHRKMTSMTPCRSRCCKCIVQGQTMDHSFTACTLVRQIHTTCKFSINQGNFIQGDHSFPKSIFHDFSMTKKWKSMTYRHNIFFQINDTRLENAYENY